MAVFAGILCVLTNGVLYLYTGSIFFFFAIGLNSLVVVSFEMEFMPNRLVWGVVLLGIVLGLVYYGSHAEGMDWEIALVQNALLALVAGIDARLTALKKAADIADDKRKEEICEEHTHV